MHEGYHRLGARKALVHTGVVVETLRRLLKTVITTSKVRNSLLLLHQPAHLDHAGLACVVCLRTVRVKGYYTGTGVKSSSNKSISYNQ